MERGTKGERVKEKIGKDLRGRQVPRDATGATGSIHLPWGRFWHSCATGCRDQLTVSVQQNNSSKATRTCWIPGVPMAYRCQRHLLTEHSSHAWLTRVMTLNLTDDVKDANMRAVLLCPSCYNCGFVLLQWSYTLIYTQSSSSHYILQALFDGLAIRDYIHTTKFIERQNREERWHRVTRQWKLTGEDVI